MLLSTTTDPVPAILLSLLYIDLSHVYLWLPSQNYFPWTGSVCISPVLYRPQFRSPENSGTGHGVPESIESYSSVDPSIQDNQVKMTTSLTSTLSCFSRRVPVCRPITDRVLVWSAWGFGVNGPIVMASGGRACGVGCDSTLLLPTLVRGFGGRDFTWVTTEKVTRI